MNLLESRKQLLIAESELNRAQLAGDVAALKADVRAFTRLANSFGSMASSATVLVAGLARMSNRKPAEAGGKTSWLQTILKSAGLISTLWAAFGTPKAAGQPVGKKTD